MSMCEKSSEWEEALNILQAMLKKRLRVDLVSYPAATRSCEAAHWALSLQLLSDMLKIQVAPLVIHYGMMIGAGE